MCKILQAAKFIKPIDLNAPYVTLNYTCYNKKHVVINS